MRSTAIYGLLVGLWVGSVRGDCYAHDGVLAKNSGAYTAPFEMVSCGNGTNNCCFQGDKCGSNLLCFTSDGNPTREYCADSNWANCSTLCIDYAPKSGTVLVDCGKNMYCCGASDNSCCDNDDEHYFVDPNTGEVKHPSKATGASATASPTWWTVDSKALLAATATSSTSSTSSISSTASSSITAPPSSTPTHSDPPKEDDSKSSGLSAGAGAGIGIGVTAVVALVAGLSWWLLKKRKQQTYEVPVEQQTNGAFAAESKGQGNGYYAYNSTPAPNHTQPPQELDGGVRPPQEMHGGVRSPQEMHGNSSRI